MRRPSLTARYFPLVSSSEQSQADLLTSIGLISTPWFHCPAQLVGFIGRKASRDHRDLHCLLLKERNTEGLAEDLQLRLREYDRLLAFSASQIRVDHVTLNRSGPDNG